MTGPIQYEVTPLNQDAYDDAIAWLSNHVIRFDPLYKWEMINDSELCVVDNNGQQEVYGYTEDGLLTLVSEDTDELVLYSISKGEWLDKMKQVFGQ